MMNVNIRIIGMAILGIMSVILSFAAYSEDNLPVKITLSLSSDTTHSSASTTLLIPAAYIDNHPETNWLELKAVLPDFRPLPPEGHRTSPSFSRSVEQDIVNSDNYIDIYPYRMKFWVLTKF